MPKRSTWRGVTWLVGGMAALIAAAIAVLLAVVFFVVAVVTTVTFIVSAPFRRSRRARAADAPLTMDARRVGGHSWVAYGWDGQH